MTDDRARTDGDLPGLMDDIPPSGDLTPLDEASRAAEGGGIRQDPEGGPFVVDQDGAVVDTGSPQDYGEPNDEVEPVEG
jgi:hypothetical protein